MLSFRDAQEEDLPRILALSQVLTPLFCHDYEELLPETFTPQWLIESHVLVFTTPEIVEDEGKWLRQETVIGFASFDGFNLDLSCHLHILIQPQYLLSFVRQGTNIEALEDRFRATRVKKFLVLQPDYNQGMAKLLKRSGFVQFATFPEEIYWHGQTQDVHYWALTRKDLATLLRQRFIQQELAEAPLKVVKTRKKRMKNVTQLQLEVV